LLKRLSDFTDQRGGYVEGVTHAFDEMRKKIDAGIEVFKNTVLKEDKAMYGWRKKAVAAKAPEVTIAHSATVVARVVAPSTDLPTTSGELTGPACRIIDSLTFWHSIGHSSPTRQQVALVAGYSHHTTSFKNALSELRVAGYVLSGSGSVSLVASVDGKPMDADSAKNKILSVLDGPNIKVVNAFDGTETALSRDVLAEKSGYAPSTSSFKNAVSRLSVLGIVLRHSAGKLQLSPWAAELLS
jgi:hypothetical protein